MSDHSPSPTAAEMRHLLRERLRDASDFDAFCHDHFRSVFQRFTNGMDRVARETLLLTHADAQAIAAAAARLPPAPRLLPQTAPLAADHGLNALMGLLPAQFEVVLARLEAPIAVLSGVQAPLAIRAAELLRWAEQQNRRADLDAVVGSVTGRPVESRTPSASVPERDAGSRARPFDAEPASRTIDFLMITALEEERDALLAKLTGVAKLDRDGRDTHTYYAGQVATRRRDGAVYRVVVTSLSGMGPIQGAIKAGAVVQRWKPAHVLLVGIAGGLEKEVATGDVMVASQIADYTVGKVRDEGPREERWVVYPADANLLSAASNFATGWEDLVSHPRPEAGMPKRHVGVIASGGDVVASQRQIAVYASDWTKLIGVEMEGGGVAAGLHDNIERPRFLMIRGVSDLADGASNTETKRQWRAYGCHVAAAYAVGLLRDGPVPGAPG